MATAMLKIKGLQVNYGALVVEHIAAQRGMRSEYGGERIADRLGLDLRRGRGHEPLQRGGERDRRHSLPLRDRPCYIKLVSTFLSYVKLRRSRLGGHR